MTLRVLVACEFSGVVREAFNAYAGVHAVSCDLLPAEDGRTDYHYQGDVRDILNDGWDLMIAHPPCTFLTVSAEWCYKDNPGKKMKPGILFGEPRRQARNEALQFVNTLWGAPIKRVCIENSVGVINSRLPHMPKPQYIQPYDFGEDASKKTGLWLRGLPHLKLTRRIPGRIVHHNGKPVERWSNQTDGGQNKLLPSDDRWKLRSVTYSGIAQAMAEQWTHSEVKVYKQRQLWSI